MTTRTDAGTRVAIQATTHICSLTVEASSAVYVERRVARQLELAAHDEWKPSETETRRQAVEAAERYEAMGSWYDPEEQRWAPIRLRINPRGGKAYADALHALKLAKASAGGNYDPHSKLWTIYNPAHGSMYLVCSGWDKHYYEAVPLPRGRGSARR